MTEPKYISKQMTAYNEYLSIWKYFYTWGVAVYIKDTRRQGSLRVNIHYKEIELANKLANKDTA